MYSFMLQSCNLKDPLTTRDSVESDLQTDSVESVSCKLSWVYWSVDQPKTPIYHWSETIQSSAQVVDQKPGILDYHQSQINITGFTGIPTQFLVMSVEPGQQQSSMQGFGKEVLGK